MLHLPCVYFPSFLLLFLSGLIAEFGFSYFFCKAPGTTTVLYKLLVVITIIINITFHFGLKTKYITTLWNETQLWYLSIAASQFVFGSRVILGTCSPCRCHYICVGGLSMCVWHWPCLSAPALSFPDLSLCFTGAFDPPPPPPCAKSNAGTVCSCSSYPKVDRWDYLWVSLLARDNTSLQAPVLQIPPLSPVLFFF